MLPLWPGSQIPVPHMWRGTHAKQGLIAMPSAEMWKVLKVPTSCRSAHMTVPDLGPVGLQLSGGRHLSNAQHGLLTHEETLGTH